MLGLHCNFGIVECFCVMIVEFHQLLEMLRNCMFCNQFCSVISVVSVYFLWPTYLSSMHKLFIIIIR